MCINLLNSNLTAETQGLGKVPAGVKIQIDPQS